MSEEGGCIVQCHMLVIQGKAEEAAAQKVPAMTYSCCSACLQFPGCMMK